MNAFVAVTDKEWFERLRLAGTLDEVNFWQPSAGGPFRALEPGELFLFKLHSPDNYIVGGGVFSHWTHLRVSLAWEAFGIKNGARSLAEMREGVARPRGGAHSTLCRGRRAPPGQWPAPSKRPSHTI